MAHGSYFNLFFIYILTFFLFFLIQLFFFSDESMRVKLWPYPEIEGSDYINASFIDVSQQFIFLLIIVRFYQHY